MEQRVLRQSRKGAGRRNGRNRAAIACLLALPAPLRSRLCLSRRHYGVTPHSNSLISPSTNGVAFPEALVSVMELGPLQLTFIW